MKKLFALLSKPSSLVNRINPRITLSVILNYQYNKQVFMADLIDISHYGLALYTDTPLKVGDMLEIDLDYIHPETAHTVSAIIVNKKHNPVLNKNRIGLKFNFRNETQKELTKMKIIELLSYYQY